MGWGDKPDPRDMCWDCEYARRIPGHLYPECEAPELFERGECPAAHDHDDMVHERGRYAPAENR